MSKQSNPQDYDFLLYPTLDEDGSFSVPTPLNEMMVMIEDMIEKDELDEEYQAMYEVVVKLLSCPAALLLEKAEEILTEIIELNPTVTVEEEETVDMSRNRRRIGFGNNIKNACDLPEHADTTKKPGEVANLIPDDDISDDDLLAEYGEKPEYLHED